MYVQFLLIIMEPCLQKMPRDHHAGEEKFAYIYIRGRCDTIIFFININLLKKLGHIGIPFLLHRCIERIRDYGFRTN